MSGKNPLTRGKKRQIRTLLEQHRLAEARQLLEQVCQADRRDAEAWYLFGAVCQQLEQFKEAETCYRHVVSLQPGNADVHYHLGNVLAALKQHAQAAEHYRLAIALNPGHIEAHCNLGGLCEQNGNPDEALACYEQALGLAPERAELHYNVGCAARRVGQLDLAEQRYRNAIRLQPGFAEAHNNLGNLLQQRARMDEAITCYRQAAALNPDYAEAFYNLAMALRDIGRVNEAIDCYRRTIQLDEGHADAHFGLSALLLLTGDFQEGWREYEWHWRRSGSPSRSLPVSIQSKSDLNGQDIFLYAEQGLGDELFFLRFIPWLKSAGTRTITYRPNPKIASLLARCPGIDRIVDAQEQPGSDQPALAVGDMPRLLGMERTSQIPAPLQLTPRIEQVAALRERLKRYGPPPYVAVTWRAGTKDNLNKLYKESPPSSLAAALKKLPATILVIQRQPQADEMATFARVLDQPAHDFSALNDDLDQMLALLSLIDDYVGVPNTNMHLRAGAGKIAKVLIPAPPEWRWTAEGNTSPWFPGFRTYRQRYDGSWAEAFDMLRADLETTYGI